MTNREILEQFGQSLLPEIKAVSKRFAPSVESEVKGSDLHLTLEITASEHIITLIDGRKPTRPNAPAGNPNLQQILLAWIKEKGIAPRADKNGRVPTLEQLSFAISKSMHMYGDLLWQRGGGNDIFAPIINQNRIDSLFSILQTSAYNKVTSEIVKNLE
jgi:hypothetical protein